MIRRGTLWPLLLASLAGCNASSERPEVVWGQRGVQPGDLVRPRAIAISPDDRVYLVDYTARIQVYDRDGVHSGLTWTTPDYRNGRPSGLSVDPAGNLIVSDSHYHCVRVYTSKGELQKTITGDFAYVSDAVRDKAGNFYVSEWNDHVDRISKLDRDGVVIKRWGTSGVEEGQFAKIRAMALSRDEKLLFVADACNHRIQVFTTDGQFVRAFGQSGHNIGDLSYPYDVACTASHLYVVEFGNSRVQKFTLEGDSLGVWGGPGREPGKLCCPWGLAIDSKGRVHIADTDNDRVQRIAF